MSFVEERVNWIKLGVYHFLFVSTVTFGGSLILSFFAGAVFFDTIKNTSDFNDTDIYEILTKGTHLVNIFLWYYAMRYSVSHFLRPRSEAVNFRQISVLSAFLWSVFSSFLLVYFKYADTPLAVLGAIIAGVVFFFVTNGALTSDESKTRSFHLTR